MNEKIRSHIKYFGGKYRICKWIYESFHKHDTYVEPYVGGGSVLLNKKKSKIEIISDIYEDLIISYIVVKSLHKRLDLGSVVCCKDTFLEACSFLDSPHKDASPVDIARAMIIKTRMSRSGSGEVFSESKRTRGGMPEHINAWRTINDEIPKIAKRLKDVLINNLPALDVIRRYDSVDTLFYLDPPYLPETVGKSDGYKHMMTTLDHYMLLDTIKECSGKVVISGNESGLYHTKLRGWNFKSVIIANDSAQSKKKKRRTEGLWMNY